MDISKFVMVLTVRGPSVHLTDCWEWLARSSVTVEGALVSCGARRINIALESTKAAMLFPTRDSVS